MLGKSPTQCKLNPHWQWNHVPDDTKPSDKAAFWQGLCAYARAHEGEAAIILGDFNTPYESVALDRFREKFYHCFTEAGRGLRETWPWPLPALSLDHIWVTRDWKPQLCRKVKRWSSDHAMVWTVLKPAPKSPSGQ